MNLKSYLTFTRKHLAFFLSLFIAFQSFAQETPKKLSAGVVLGVPVTFFSVKSAPVGLYTGSVRYSLNKTISIEGKLTAGTFYNNSTGNKAKTTLNGTPSDVLTYRTPVYGFNVVGYYNLHNIFGLNKRPQSKWLPFANLGLGLNIYKPWVTYVNKKSSRASSFGKPFRDYQFGIGTRYYINSNLDLVGGIEYHIAETYYLDGLKEKVNPSLDQYMNFYAGINIKFGAKPWNNLVDWNHKNIENPNESPKLYSNWAIDGTIGVPFMFTPVGYNFTAMAGIGIRHSFNRAMGLQFNIAAGKVAGDQATTGTPKRGTPDNVKSFNTNLTQMSVRAYFNIFNLSVEPQVRSDWNHYVILGAGYTSAKGDATFQVGAPANNKKLSAGLGIQSIVFGYEARKYMTHNIDLIGGVDFGYNQTKYLDQGYNKPSLNSHIYIHTGVTYKIGTSKDKEHIDWSYGNYNNFKDKKTTIEQVPVIEKPITEEPKIDTSSMVAIPVEPTPATVEPTPAPVVEPTPAPVVSAPVVSEPVVSAPSTVVEPVPAPKAVQPTPAPKPLQPIPSQPGEVAPPPAKYNVIVACYSIKRLSVAKAAQTKFAQQGYDPSLYRSSSKSKLVRMSVISTDDLNEALRTLRKARKEIDPQSWIYLYNKQ
jgi:hypothetical protein